jgi:uncharacterized repeat protein (TIGR02543 family)
VETPTPAGLHSAAVPEGLSTSDWSGIRGAYEKHRYAIVANSDGSHQARNAGQAWLAKFDGSGFTVIPDAGGWIWGLELSGYGEATEVRQEGGKISYLREDGLTEWFINDSRGLEQGWTLEKRPARAGSSGPLRLDLTVRGDLRPQVAAGAASVAFLDEAGGAALTYGGLKAWDADGKAVQARFAEGEAADASFCVVVDDVEARYPITVDPVAQQATLTASNAESGANFGASVALDGDTVVVGAPLETVYILNQNGTLKPAGGSGAVYVFVRGGGGWEQQQRIDVGGSLFSGNQFGCSVGISGDTVVAGALGANQYKGFVRVFVRIGTVWAAQGYLTSPVFQIGDKFGAAVAVAGDTVVVGAPDEDSSATGINGDQLDDSASSSGAVYVFVRNGTAWDPQAYLKAHNTGSNDRFGASVAVTGGTVLVGAMYEGSSATGVNSYQNDNLAPGSGAAYVFSRQGAAWTQEAYLKSSNSEAGDCFGGAVALSGSTAVVGSFGEDSNATGVNGNQADNSAADSGASYVFVRGGGGWSQEAYLKASVAGAEDGFGTSVAVAGDTLIIGAHGEDSAATGVNGDPTDDSVPYAGAAYLFERSAAVWSQRAYLKGAISGESYRFGTAVAVSAETSVVGAPLDAWGATERRGASYVFERSFSLAAVAAHGQIVGAGNYEGGTTATLTVTAAPGYLFTGWSGDATGSGNPLSVLMDADKTLTATFGPDTADDDEDGLTNFQEIVEIGSNPNLPNTDGDTTDDGDDAFPLDPAETLDTDRDGTGDNADLDDDGDGLSDVDELTVYVTNPKRADSDGDGLRDKDELEVHFTNPLNPDHDGDGLSDGAEFLTHFTNPKVADSDGDGFLDGYEVLTGKLPLDPLSKPALVAEAQTAIEFTFSSALGKIYRIESSTDLAIWTPVESGIAGNGGQIQRFYTTRNLPKRYFRVEEDAP